MAEEKRRATRHEQSRSKTGAPFGRKHNDRRYNYTKDEHIDQSKTDQNIYWNCIEDCEYTHEESSTHLSFNQAETQFYKEHFGQYLKRVNDKAHKGDKKTMNQYMNSPKSCPREAIFQLGDVDHPIDYDTFMDIFHKQIKWEQKTFPFMRILDYAIHVDEQSIHAHIRYIPVGYDDYGLECPNQIRAFLNYNAHISDDKKINLPKPNEKVGKFNSYKITYSKMCREHTLELCRQHGLEMEESPKDKSMTGLDQITYKYIKTKEKLEKMKIENNELKEEIEWNQNLLTIQQNELKEQLDTHKKELESINEKVENAQNSLKNLVDEIKDNEEVKQQIYDEAKQAYHELMNCKDELDHAVKEKDHILEEKSNVTKEYYQIYNEYVKSKDKLKNETEQLNHMANDIEQRIKDLKETKDFDKEFKKAPLQKDAYIVPESKMRAFWDINKSLRELKKIREENEKKRKDIGYETRRIKRI